MTKIAFVTDTNASLPADIIQKYHIIIVPIHIQFGEETYVTGKNINDQSLFSLIDQRKILPTTAAPAPDAFQKAFQQAFDAGYDEIVCVCCSSAVSATFNAAEMAAGMFPERSISVVDSQMLSLAEGYQVIMAAESAADGADIAAILAQIEAKRGRFHVYAALPTLKYLAMGGRMGKLAAGFAETLEIKPILTLREGKLELLEKVRTWRKARERLVELAELAVGGSEVERIGMIHVNNEEGTRNLYSLLAERITLSEAPIVAEFSPGLSVHAGSGVIGFVIVTKD